MRKWIARGAVGLTVLVSGAGAAFMVLADMGERKLARRIDVAVTPVAFRSDAASIERGAYLFKSRGCGDCHGADGAGHVVVEDGKGLLVRSPDITPAPNGVVAAYTPADWVRTVRHGVKPDGRPVMIMPSEEYNRFVDADLAAVVAYVRRLPAAAGAKAEIRLPMPVKALYAAGVVKDASEKIDHTLPPAQPVPEGVTAAHGAYVANGCIGCHGAKLAGGKIPGAPPEWPPAAKLTPGAGSALDRYPSAEQFMAMLKSGKRPDGSSVSTVMPFASLKEMNEVDVRALYLHLRSLPASS
jgi:mono/diheme cytochrome c family protein